MLSTTNMEYSTLKQLEIHKLVTPLKDSTIGNHNVLLVIKDAFKICFQRYNINTRNIYFFAIV